MNASTPNVFFCNNASKPSGLSSECNVVTMAYLKGDPNRLVNLKLPRFVDQMYYLPDRVLDLLEIAAYVFAADRWAYRGPKQAVEFHAWSRSMHFYIRVRDIAFWNKDDVKAKLAAV